MQEFGIDAILCITILQKKKKQEIWILNKLKGYDFIENIDKYVLETKTKTKRKKKKKKVKKLGVKKWTVSIINNLMHFFLTLLLKLWSSNITWELVQNTNSVSATDLLHLHFSISHR